MSKKAFLLAATCLILLFVLGVQAQVRLTAFSKPFQLYCRDAQDSAVTAVSGAITTAGAESVSVTLYKNNAQIKRFVQHLQYAGVTASFSFFPKIHAELSAYKVELRMDAALVASADSVVCGDAFLVDGQSNASMPGDVAPHPFVRTFGAWDGQVLAAGYSDTAWGVAQTGVHRVNNWGLLIAKRIVNTYSVPVCVISGGVGGSAISEHSRSTDLNRIYGRYLYRISKANLQNGIKWVMWHQGESNANDAYYKAEFLSLCDAWKTDFPGIRHFYLFQIRPGCGGAGYVTREQQRLVPQGRPDISIMSTVNIPNHDGDPPGCHYSEPGYAVFADWMYPLVARDIYGSTDTVRIRPPDIREAWFADMAHKRIMVRFDQPVLVPADTGIRHVFAVGRTVTKMDSVTADTSANTITLFLHDPSDSATLSYVIEDWHPTFNLNNYSTNVYGPWLYNTRGIGALTFYRYPMSVRPGAKLTVTLLDSVTQQKVTTPVAVMILKDNAVVDSVKTQAGALTLIMDYNTHYAFNVSAAGYAPRTGVEIVVGTRDTAIIIRCARQPLSGITALPDTLDLITNVQYAMPVYGIYPDGTRLPLDGYGVIPAWTSRLPGLVSVNGSGVLSSNGQTGSCFIIADIPSRGYRDSTEVHVIQSVIIRNPSFETPASSSDWTMTTGAAIEANGGPYLQANAPDGVKVARLQSTGSISQIVMFCAGALKVQFMAAKRASYGGLQPIKVTVDEMEIGSVTPNSADFIQYATPSFSVTPGAHTLKFQGTNSVGDNTGFIDRVSIVDSSTHSTEDEPVADTRDDAVLSASPNPFNPSVNIKVHGCNRGSELKIYSVNGSMVEDLSINLNNGTHSEKARQVVWNANGHASGVYVIVLRTGMITQKQKCILIR